MSQEIVNAINAMSSVGVLCVMIFQTLWWRNSASAHSEDAQKVTMANGVQRSYMRTMVLCLLILALLAVELFDDSLISRLFVLKVVMLGGAFYVLMLHATLMEILSRR